jgi:hypothetical protein
MDDERWTINDEQLGMDGGRHGCGNMSSTWNVSQPRKRRRDPKVCITLISMLILSQDQDQDLK